MGQVFTTVDGRPRLRRCAVLYLDLLGVRQMARSGLAATHLVAIEDAISGRYRDFLDPASPWPAAFFSDTLVLTAPILKASEERDAVLGLILQAAHLQLELALQGLFVRGGIATGLFHINNGLIFGHALVAAYELESKDAVHPRVILDKDSQSCQKSGVAGGSEQGSLLLCDADGWTFIDYLAVLFDEPRSPRPRIRQHRAKLNQMLEAHAGDRRRWEKYRWLAEYHNAVVSSRLSGEHNLLVPTARMTWQFKAFQG